MNSILIEGIKEDFQTWWLNYGQNLTGIDWAILIIAPIVFIMIMLDLWNYDKKPHR